jgi:hypothetical protein
MKSIASIALAGLMAVALAGCTSSRTTNATLIGGGIGAAIGGIATHSVGGAVVGGAIGAGTGYVLSKHSYRCQKRNIFGQVYWGTCLR